MTEIEEEIGYVFPYIKPGVLKQETWFESGRKESAA
jgi:hypothetical protein